MIPKTEARVWIADGDGSCLFHSILGTNNKKDVRQLRAEMARYVADHLDEEINGPDLTIQTMILDRKYTVEEFLRLTLRDAFEAGEMELVVLSRMLNLRLRVYVDRFENWEERAEYGQEGRIVRLLYRRGTSAHYDLIVPKERWLREMTEQAKEQSRNERRNPEPHGTEETQANAARAGVKQQWMQRCKQQAQRLRLRCREEVEAEAKKRRSATVQQKRQPLLHGLPSDWERWDIDQVTEIDRILQARQPWQVLGVPESATPDQCTRVFRKKSITVHPDKCAHPLAADAFKKLCEAQQGWGLNRQEWLAEQAAMAATSLERQRAEEWERQGGRLRWWAFTEMLERLLIEAEESHLYIQGTEAAEWTKLMTQGREGWIKLSQQSTSQRLYCVCRKPENRREYWVRCMECGEWYHPKCVGTTPTEYEQARNSGLGWRCPKCEEEAMDLS